MANKITIDVEARAKGLQAILDQINKIKTSNGLNLTEGTEKQLKVLEAQLKNLLESTKGKNLLPDSEEFKLFERELEKIANGLGKVNNKLLEMRIPEQFKKQIDEAQKKIEDLQNEIKTTRSGATGQVTKTRKKADGSGYELSASGERQALTRMRKDGGNTTIGAEEITRWEQVVALQTKINELHAKGLQGTEEEESIYKRISKHTTDIVNESTQARQEVENKVKALQDEVALQQQIIAEATAKGLEVGENGTGADNKKVVAEVGEVNNALRKQSIEWDRATAEAKDHNRTIDDVGQGHRELGDVLDQTNQKQEKNTSLVKKAATQVLTYGTIVGLLRSAYQKTIQTITKMDEALTGMAVVTNMSREQTWELVGSFQELATQTGKTSSEIANMATKFYQQGKSTTQVLQLTEAAAKAATIAGISGERSIDLLTNAMNGFQLAASEAMNVSDKFAALAAASATDYEELAVALSKVAAQANLAGMSMDFTLGMLSKGIEVTREAPETIGTALKTVIARMRELTDYGETLEDGMDVNRVAKALSNIGVELMDEEGQFRDLEAVITEVGMKWDTLNKNQQANVAVAMAGTRQQSRLIAMMQDFDRTLELVDISANSYGATLAQQTKYMEGMEAKTALLSNAWEQLITTLVQSDVVIGAVEGITGLVETLTYILDPEGMNLMIPALIAIGAILLDLGAKKAAQAAQSVHARQLEKIANAERLVEVNQELQGLDAKAAREKLNQKLEAKTAALESLHSKQNLRDLKLEEKAEKKLNIIKDDSLDDAAKQVKLAALDAEYADDLAKANAEVATAASEYNVASQEASEALNEVNRITSLQVEKQGLLQSGAASWKQELLSNFGILQLIPAAMSVIQTIQAVINAKKTASIALSGAQTAATGAETAAIVKHTAAVTADTAAEVANAGAKAAGNAAAIPVEGWVIALAILAAIGIAIAVSAAAGAKKTTQAADESRDALNKLQADLYNLSNARKNVQGLADEFENLSNKVIKSAEDVERLKEIAQAINDEAGYEVVDLTADAKTQQAQIEGYDKTLAFEQGQNIKAQKEGLKDLIKADHMRINEETGEAYTANDLIGANWGIAAASLASGPATYWTVKAAVDNRNSMLMTEDEILKSELQGQTMQNAIRNIAASQMDMTGFSSESNTLVMDALVAAMQEDPRAFYNTATGDVDTAKFQQELLAGSTFTGANGWAEFGSELAEVQQEGGLDDYIALFDQLGESGQTALGRVDPIFEMLQADEKEGGSVYRDAIERFGDLGTSAQDLNQILTAVNDNPYLDGKQLLANSKDVTEFYENYAQQMRNSVAESEAFLSKVATMRLEDATEGTKEYAYLQLQADITAKKAAISAKEAAIESEKDEDKKEELKKDLQDLNTDLSALEAEEKSYIITSEEAEKEIAAMSSVMAVTPVSDFTDQITKLCSTMERLAKVTDLSSMSIKDQMELLADYPELYEAMMRGGQLTAEDMVNTYKKQFEALKQDIDVAKANLWVTTKTENNLSDAVIDNLKKNYNNYVGLDLEDGSSASSEFIELIGDEDKAFKVLADLRAQSQYDVQDEYLGDDWTKLLDNETTQKILDQVTGFGKATLAINEEKEALEMLNEESEEYASALANYNNSLLDGIAEGEKKLTEIADNVNGLTGDLDEENNFLKPGQSLMDVIDFTDGTFTFDEGWYNSLTETQQASFKSIFGQLETYAEEYEDVSTQIQEWDQEWADNQVAEAERAAEAQTESLEKRKEAYENYFEEMDNLEAEEETEANRKSLVNQIQALTSATDGASKAKLKELRQQLEELNKEQLAQQKEEQRNALLDSLDSEIERVDTHLQELTTAIYEDLAERYKARTGTDYQTPTTDTTGATTTTTTTDTTVEDDAVNNATQTTADNANTAYEGGTKVVTETVTNTTTQSVQIDELNIHTESLDTDQDFKLLADKIFNYVFERIKTENGLK